MNERGPLLSQLVMAMNAKSASTESKYPPVEVRPIAAGETTNGMISMDEVEKHNSLEHGIWVTINGNVYECVSSGSNRQGSETDTLPAA